MSQFQTWFNQKNWYQPTTTLVVLLLLPFSWLYAAIIALRRWCYLHGIFASWRCDHPVIVVGNITVGGTGKTPLVIALVRQLTAAGWQPGVVSRGVGGKRLSTPVLVTHESSVADVGDEALLLARSVPCPMVICPDRVKAVKALLEAHPACNVIITDDGLQHYRLQRDLEIVVVDSARQFGNGNLLPAGPLREPVSRLDEVDFIVVNGGDMPGGYAMTLKPTNWVAAYHSGIRADLAKFDYQSVHACAGIGNPDRFFNLLKARGMKVQSHAFPDHYAYKKTDFDFGDQLPVLMTAKDAVKCEIFADRRMWYLEVTANLQPVFWQQLLSRLKGIR